MTGFTFSVLNLCLSSDVKQPPVFRLEAAIFASKSLNARILDTIPYPIRTYQDPLPRGILIRGFQALT